MINKKYGEFSCNVCGKVFFQKHLLSCHKSIHVKGTKPKCRKCKVILIEGKNWTTSLVKASSRVCNKCIKEKNKENYNERKRKKVETARKEKNK